MAYRILVTGASIAGNAAAYWLSRAGHEVEVVERTSAFRDGGQNIDVRGPGRDVLRLMGLEDAVSRGGTGEVGTAWIDAEGRVAAEFDTDDLSSDGPTAELEILRGDLARLLYDAAKDAATYVFDETADQVVQDDDDVRVEFSSGRMARYDLMVVAEGVGSSTRDRIFYGENDPRWMDMTIAYFTIPRVDDDDQLWRWYHATGGRSLSLRPDPHGTIRAMLSIQHASEGEQDWSSEQQKAFLRDTFHDAGWQASRILEGMDHTDDFYFDVLRQVRMKRWSKSRVVLLGDAAWCVTPMGGAGATLALTGAYVLAGELARQSRFEEAFQLYEETLRPMVEDIQGIPKAGTRMMNPHTRLGIRLLHGVLNLASRPPIRDVAAKLMQPSYDPIDLSPYVKALGADA